MKLGEFVASCSKPNANPNTVYMNIKGERCGIMISADLDYMNEIVSLGDKRMELTVKSWTPSVFSHYSSVLYPSIEVIVDA